MIVTIDELIHKLKQSSIENFPKVLSNLELNPEDFKPYESWSDDTYTRNCIARTEKFELLLLCWNGQQTTPIHDHGGEQCWVYQLKGDVFELRFEEDNQGDLEKTQAMTLTPGKLTYMDDSMGYHALENKSNQRAMTLHIYALPIDECEIFDEEEETFETKEMEYDTVAPKAVR